jgi:hypothetical protein
VRTRPIIPITIIYSLIALVVVTSQSASACTTGLASRDATSNQHCLLWKNRDSGFQQNAVHFFNIGDFQFIGIINAGDTTQIWAGVNNFGFAIMNAESRDMAVPGDSTEYDDEGYLMKTALAQCQTIQDFEQLLLESNATGRKVTSNFGVIDALGNAAYFETGNHEYFRFDANQTEQGSHGFLIRANFAFKARSTEGYGRVRYQRAFNLFQGAIAQNALEAQYIIQKVATDIYLDADSNSPDWLAGSQSSQNTINRFRTVACAVFDGNAPEEPAGLTTFWCTLGEPIVSIAIPLWVSAGTVPSQLDSAGYSPLNQVFRDLKALVYSDFDNPEMVTLEKTRAIQKELQPLREKVYRDTQRQLKRWSKHTPAAKDLAAFQNKMINYVSRSTKKILRKWVRSDEASNTKRP